VILQQVSQLAHPTLGSSHEFDVTQNVHIVSFRDYLKKSELLHELCHAKLYETGYRWQCMEFEPPDFTNVGPPKERFGREAGRFEPFRNACHLWWISRGFSSEFYADLLMFEAFPLDSKKVAQDLVDWISEPPRILKEWEKDMLTTIRSFAANASLLLRAGYPVSEAANETLRIFFLKDAGEDVYNYVRLAMDTIQTLPWPLPEHLSAEFIKQRLAEMKMLFNAVPEKLGGVVLVNSAEPCGDHAVTLKWSPKTDVHVEL
jgi:hypothetical protein